MNYYTCSVMAVYIQVALYVVDQTLPSERRGHYQQLIPQQYACRSKTQNFMTLFKFSLKNAVFTHELAYFSMRIVKTNSFFMFSYSPIIRLIIKFESIENTQSPRSQVWRVVRLLYQDNEHWTVTKCAKDKNKPPKINSYTAYAQKTDKIQRS
jgi:hypothetical protein